MRCREQGLQLLFVIGVEVVEVLDLVTVGFLVTLRLLSILADDLLDLLLQQLDVLVVLATGSFQIGDVLLHLVLALLSHQGLAHTVGD